MVLHQTAGRAAGKGKPVAIIPGAVTLIGVLASHKASPAVTDQRLDALTREVWEHNGFAKRKPVIEEQIKVINHCIRNLEGDAK